MATGQTADDFLCSICLGVFTKPASIPCGHTFCLDCITNYWDTCETLFQCPLCLEKFYSKPMLRVNILIGDMAERFKNTVEKKSSSTPDEPESEKVLCDICTNSKLTAVKSCLVCFISYCPTHLKPHQKITALKKHKLIPPVKNLESRMCKNHDELLELFCQADQLFLCESCKNKEHRTHKVVSLEEEAKMRKTKLGTEKADTDQMIQSRQQKILELQCLLEVSRQNAEKALSCSKHVMSGMVDYIKRSQHDMTEVINTKLKKIEEEAKCAIDELDEEIIQIKLKNTELCEVQVSEDPFTFLENFLSLKICSPKVKDWSDVTINSDQFRIQEAMVKLETTISQEIDTLCDPTFKQKQRYAVNVVLDSDTANPSLNVSEDGKQVAHGNTKRQVRNKPERFDHVLNVLAKEGFSSGKFYYEVQVKDKTQWDLGVANESINRKGDIRLSPKNGYWTIWLRKKDEFTANAGPAIKLHLREMPRKVGVFVDYEGGEVSFYDVDLHACIFSFTGWAFTEKLFPFFSPCSNDGGKNSAPLIITPVIYSC